MRNGNAMSNTLQTNLMLGGELISEIAVFGSRGYDKQGNHAVAFIRDINRDAYINTSSVKDYLDDVVRLNAESEWLDEKAEDRAEKFIELLQDHVHRLSIESARAVIDFCRQR
jgi:hypothetical protein